MASVSPPRPFELLLDLGLDIRVASARRRSASRYIAELVRYTGEKELNVRHSPPPALWPRSQCGMPPRVRKGRAPARRAVMTIRANSREL